MEQEVIVVGRDEWKVAVLRKDIDVHRGHLWRVEWKWRGRVTHEVIATGEDILSGNVPEIEVVE